VSRGQHGGSPTVVNLSLLDRMQSVEQIILNVMSLLGVLNSLPHNVL
jgi:hypothetical protein